MPKLSSADRELLLAGLPVLKVLELPIDGRPLIYYREGGSPNGIPLIMLHGGSSDSGDYRGQLAGLGDRYRIISWCVPGYGGSSTLGIANPNGEDFAKIVQAFSAALEMDSFHLVGSSLGSVIGLCVAAYYPEIVRSLVQISPNTGAGFLHGVDHENWLAAWLDRNIILDANPRQLGAMLTTAESSELVHLRAGAMREAITEQGYEEIIRMMSNTDTVALSPNVKAPVLILAGGADQVAPFAEHGELIAAATETCETEILPDFGHLLQIEAPSKVNELIAAFIQKHEVT